MTKYELYKNYIDCAYDYVNKHEDPRRFNSDLQSCIQDFIFRSDDDMNRERTKVVNMIGEGKPKLTVMSYVAENFSYLRRADISQQQVPYSAVMTSSNAASTSATARSTVYESIRQNFDWNKK